MRTTFFQAKNPVCRLVRQDCSLVARNLPLCSISQRLPGGTLHMKGVGMLVGNFELNPLRRPIWAWPELKIYISNIYFYISWHATLNETFTDKYDGVLPRRS